MATPLGAATSGVATTIDLFDGDVDTHFVNNKLMQHALVRVYHGLRVYALGFLNTSPFNISADRIADAEVRIVDELGSWVDELILVVEMFVDDNVYNGQLGETFNAFMDKHANSIREIVIRSVRLVQSVQRWPGQYAWMDMHCKLVKLLEWYYQTNLHPTFSNNNWGRWLARMLVVTTFEYDFGVRLAKALLRYLRNKRNGSSELEASDVTNLRRLNEVVARQVASLPRGEVNPLLSNLLKAIVGVVDPKPTNTEPTDC